MNLEDFWKAFCFFFAATVSSSRCAAASRSGKISGAAAGRDNSVYDFPLVNLRFSLILLAVEEEGVRDLVMVWEMSSGAEDQEERSEGL